VTLSWHALPGETRFKYQLLLASPLTSIADAFTTQSTVTVKGLTPGTTYEWRVVVDDTNGKMSPWSSLSPVTTAHSLPPIPPPPPAPIPDGVPASQVGSLVLNDTGAQLYSAWSADPVNSWCGDSGDSVSGDNLVLTAGSGCTDIGSPVAYTTGIFQATFSTSTLSGHPAFWMSGFSSVQGAGAWTNYGEIDAAEAPNSGEWDIFYHAHGATNAYYQFGVSHTAGTHTVDIVRLASGECDIYWDGTEVATFPTDMLNGVPTPLLLMFDTSGTTTPLVVSNLSIWNLSQ